MEAKVIPLPNTPSPTLYRLDKQADTTLPLFSTRVRAGFPSPATDYTSEPVDLNRFLSESTTSTFLVEVEGDSMIGAHIMPGDLAVVDRDKAVRSGQVVLAYVNGEFTIKRFELKDNVAYLVPENPAYRTMRFDNPEHCRIWGVVTGIARRL